MVKELSLIGGAFDGERLRGQFADGRIIVTSKVQDYSIVDDKIQVETMNSTYQIVSIPKEYYTDILLDLRKSFGNRHYA